VAGLVVNAPGSVAMHDIFRIEPALHRIAFDKLYRTSDLQMKYMPFGLASGLVALLAAVVLYAGWCGGTSGAVKGLQFGLIMGVFVACIHPISNLVTMNMDVKLGLEITVSTAIGWVLAGLVTGLVYKPIAPLGIASR
jgi:hypothetical protein